MILKENKNIPINGLVLTGGKSSRMGASKDLISWHGRQQRYHMADLLTPFCDQIYISCRADQLVDFDSRYNALSDTFIGMGPTGGILTALAFNRNVAWLVVACDLPLLDNNTLAFLVENRNIEKIATTYKSPFDELPEPLITIWEPQSYPVLLRFLGEGRTCPRKVLINSDIHLLQPSNPDSLMNVNTPSDAEKAKHILHNR